MSGASVLQIAEILGHKVLQMTKLYTHLSDANRLQVIAPLDSVLFI